MADNTQTLRAVLDTSGFKQGELSILVSITNVNNAIDQGNNKLTEHEAKLNSLAQAAQALTGVFGGLVGAFSLDKLIEVNTTYDRLATEMNTVTGSATGAHQAITNLIQFTNQTPYTLDQVSDAFIRLRNAGLDASNGMMLSLSNVASSMGRPIGDITDAIAAAAVGNTEMLRGFGIESQSAGDKITMTFQGISQTIARNGPSIERYMAALGNGVFEGDTDRQSQTIGGQMTRLQDAVENVMRAVGDGGFNDAFRGLIGDAITATNETQNLASAIGHTLGDAINDGRDIWKNYGTEVEGVATAIGTVIAAGTGLAAIETVITVLTALISPWSLAIGGAAAAILLVKDRTVELGGQSESVLQATKDIWHGIADYASQAASAVAEYASKIPHPSLPDFGTPTDAQGRMFDANGRQLARSGVGTFIRGGLGLLADDTLGRLARHGRAAEAGEEYLARPEPEPGAPIPVAAPSGVLRTTLPNTDLMLRPGLLSDTARQNLQAHPEYLQAAQQAAQANNIPVNFFLRTLDTESHFDPNAVSPTGARGIGQIMPNSVRDPGSWFHAPEMQGNPLSDPVANIQWSAAYLAQRARHEQGTDNPDWLRALGAGTVDGGYGTLSEAGNQGNIQRVIEQRQQLTAALRMDPGYATYQDTGIHASSQATAAATQLQQSVYAQSLSGEGSGALKALTTALVNAGYGTSVDPNNPNAGMRAMTRTEMLDQVANGNYTADNLRDFDTIAQDATSPYNHQIETSQNNQVQLNNLEKEYDARVALSKQMEIQYDAQKTLVTSEQQGMSADQARRASVIQMTTAYEQLNRQVATAQQSARLTTQQDQENTRAIGQQGVYWDDNSSSYILDTRQADATRLRQQIDPYGLNPNSASVAQEEAQANWEKERAADDANQRLGDISRSDPVAGMKSAWHSFEDEFNDINSDMKKTFSDTMDGFNNSMTSFITTGKGGWKSLADSVVTDITNMSLHYAESQLFQGMGGSGGVGGLFSSLFGLGGGGDLFAGAGVAAFAKGGVFNSGLSQYSNSIVSSPTHFAGIEGARYATGASLMGEAGPEAIMPLKRSSDGSLGVRVSGASGGGMAVSMGDINIHNPTVTDGKMDTKTAAALNKQVSDIVTQRVQQIMTNQQRPGGFFYGAGKRT